MKTIKQITDNLGIDKQKVYRYIRKNLIDNYRITMGFVIGYFPAYTLKFVTLITPFRGKGQIIQGNKIFYHFSIFEKTILIISSSKSTALIYSHSTMPVILLLLSRQMWRGKFFCIGNRTNYC